MARTLSDSPARERFRVALLRWFDCEKRSLPWRGETDPYRILVSEVMLQQTRVAVVKERYKRFLLRFPTISRLARARLDSVLAEWSGLGYYRRARALHGAAREVLRRGAFPHSAEELEQLPGIGRYTAAAVASIAFTEPVAVVDGNVKRVLQRLTGRELSSDGCWQTAEDLLESRRPGDFNQAMMELGATVCLPGQPVCERCPVREFCATSRTGQPPRTAPTIARNKATLSYLLARKDGALLLRQRPANVALMPGMWELPPLRRDETKGRSPVLKLRHSITTTDYSVLVFSTSRGKHHPGAWVSLRSAGRLPLTGLTRKILRKVELLS